MKLPKIIQELLKNEKFCILSTSYKDNPHVSLMNFTYLPEEGLIILSSRADTSKVQHIASNPSVAFLLYSLGSDNNQAISCSFYGTAKIIASVDDQVYKEKHLAKHHDMNAFISGDNISMITVTLDHAKIADAKDRVRTWSRKTL